MKPEEFEHIFNPRAVAVVGASPNDIATLALMSTKIRERLFLVNPKYKELFGKRCYASVLDINEEVDYAAIVVASTLVPKVLDECIEKGIKAAQIYSAGFSETGIKEKIQLENEIRSMAKGRIRLIGPNCFGVYCPKSGLSIIPEASSEEGPVGVISQSGSVAESFSYFGGVRNIKFSKMISYGNAIDLDCPDFLEYLADDPETKVIAIYVEGTGDGSRFRSALNKAASKKPVVAIKGGTTKHGRRAASSHTGSLAGSPETWSSLFKQAGAIQVRDYDELVNTVLAFSYSPLPSGNGVSIITNSGGFSVIQTDLCAETGLDVPPFGEETLRALRKMVPTAGTSIGNPLDAWPIYYNLDAHAGNLIDIIKTVALDKKVHSLVFQFDQLRYLRRILAERLAGHMEELLNAMITGCECAREETGKPVFICVSLDPYSEDEEDRRYNLTVKKAFESRQFPVYPSLYASIKALSNIYKYSFSLHHK